MAASCSKQKKLSLEEVIAGVLQSDEENELSSFEESESELEDFEDEEGNQMLFVRTPSLRPKRSKELLRSNVMDLMNPFLNKNHNLYFDNFYTSPKLLNDLIPKGTYACGTISTRSRATT